MGHVLAKQMGYLLYYRIKTVVQIPSYATNKNKFSPRFAIILVPLLSTLQIFSFPQLLLYRRASYGNASSCHKLS
jgi:hypothetical protein